MTSRASFNPAVHGARGLFAMMVFIYHVVNAGLPGWPTAENPLNHYFFKSFQFGVELFFGISGFVIIGALGRAPSLRSFLWDRATRIYPLLWLTLVAITAASFAVDRWRPPLDDWLLNFLAPPPFFPLPQVNPAAWSLGYEITFYVLCGVCWALRRQGGRAWLWLAIGAGAVLLALFPRAALMPAGVLIAAGLITAPRVRALAAWPGLWLVAFLIGWRALDIARGGDIMTLSPARMPLDDWLALLPATVVVALLGGLALLGIVEQRGLLGRGLRTAPLQWLGTISYSFYLWHPVVMGPAKSVLQATGIFEAAGPFAQLLFAAVTLPPALLVAHVSQRLVEVRLTRWLRRLGPREGDGRAPATAAATP